MSGGIGGFVKGVTGGLLNAATLGGYNAYKSSQAQKKAASQQAAAQARAQKLQEEANTQAEQQNNRVNSMTVTDYSDTPDRENSALLTSNNGAKDGYSLGAATLLGGDDEDLY